MNACILFSVTDISLLISSFLCISSSSIWEVCWDLKFISFVEESKLAHLPEGLLTAVSGMDAWVPPAVRGGAPPNTKGWLSGVEEECCADDDAPLRSCTDGWNPWKLFILRCTIKNIALLSLTVGNKFLQDRIYIKESFYHNIL